MSMELLLFHLSSFDVVHFPAIISVCIDLKRYSKWVLRSTMEKRMTDVSQYSTTCLSPFLSTVQNNPLQLISMKCVHYGKILNWTLITTHSLVTLALASRILFYFVLHSIGKVQCAKCFRQFFKFIQQITFLFENNCLQFIRLIAPKFISVTIPTKWTGSFRFVPLEILLNWCVSLVYSLLIRTQWLL